MYSKFSVNYVCLTSSEVAVYVYRRTGKQINRRATGVPGRMKMSFYEPTDPGLSEKPRQAAKRSVSNAASFLSSPPSQPPPRLNSSQVSPRSKRRLSAEPELPLGVGESNENLTPSPQTEEKRSRESSRQSSVNRLSGLSEDLDERGDYEPIDRYLVEKCDSDGKVPLSQSSHEGSPKSHRSSTSEAPHYPAPLPPSTADQTKSTTEEDGDSDGYEPVKLAGQEDIHSANQYRDEVERAVLPLKTTGPMRVGGRREHSPNVLQSLYNLSKSPPHTGPISSSLPASSTLSSVGPSHLLRPPIKDKSPSPPRWADTKLGKILIPPEPSSPPPSPPVGRDVVSPLSRPVPAERNRSLSPPTEQPVLPPKKKSAKNPTYESHIPKSESVDEGIYAFDTLSPLTAGTPKTDIGSPRRTDPSLPAAMAMADTVVQDDVYFDHLASNPPPIPKKSRLTSQASMPDSQPSGNDIYFDHLASGPPPSPSTARKTSPAGQMSEQTIDESVYFDHLVTGTPPAIPTKTGQMNLPETQFSGDDQVYFDHLAEPVKPVQPSALPKVPPRRQSSITSEMNPGKRPVSANEQQSPCDQTLSLIVVIEGGRTLLGSSDML